MNDPVATDSGTTNNLSSPPSNDLNSTAEPTFEDKGDVFISNDVSPLLQHDVIDQQLHDDLLSIQNLEDEFVTESQQLADELNNYENSSDENSSANDESEIRSVEYSTTDDELRSETPTPPPRSEHYDLRPNPPQTSESHFDAEHYKYSFLQMTKKTTSAVRALINEIDDTWRLDEEQTEKKNSEIVKNGIQSNMSSEHCRKAISSQLKRIENNQAYDKQRLHTSLIQLIHNKLFPYPKETSDNNNHTNVCLTQMSAKKGIERFGERALQAIITEYEQFENLSVFTPISLKHLSPSDRKLALHAIDLIKEKRTGKLKGRTVADGRKQRPLYDKQEISSPALSQDGFMASLVIDACENRSTAIADIAGAFLKAEQNDHVVVKFRGPAVEALLRINEQKYKQFIVHENKSKVIYVKLLKAMYGTLTAPILWYKMFANTLLEDGFTLNPYDACVANKMVNDHQMTVCWYVDDLKVSHVQQTEVKAMMDKLENRFGKMSITYGAEQQYLGMDLLIKDGVVRIMMKSYLEEAIKAFEEPINSAAKSPSTRTLHEIDENSPLLTKDETEKFHHIVAKLLYVSKRARLDIQPTVVFLCRRVRNPTEQDKRKLKRLLQYIYGTLEMPRILSIRNFSEMSIYVDASHAPHVDGRGQTGGCVVMGQGVLHSTSTRQQINTKSSTETELVGASEYLPYALWLIHFFRAQGYEIEKKTILQDNESTIKLLKNGRNSAGKQSRHISIRYFWIVDRLKKEKIYIEYCPTGLMLADFFTKPLQGSLFRKMRDVVMGLQPITILKTEEELARNIEPMKTNSQATKDENSCINLAKVIPTPILKHNKERVTEKNNRKNVNFSDDCVFNNKNSNKSMIRNTKDNGRKSILLRILE